MDNINSSLFFHMDGFPDAGAGSPNFVGSGDLRIQPFIIDPMSWPQIICDLDHRGSDDDDLSFIEVWELKDAGPEKVNLVDEYCYPIGNTTFWGWSLENLGLPLREQAMFFWKMSTDENNYNAGVFVLYPQESKGTMRKYILDIASEMF